MFIEIHSPEELSAIQKNQSAALVYFSTEACSVCKVLKPKIEKLIQDKFPKVALCHANMNEMPELAAQHQVFSAPTLLLFFDGREYIRKSRNIAIKQLDQDVSRIYNLLFR